jgi:hypothetical protein
VLPSGWSATDDATTATRHPAWMLHDAEGTPTRRVEAVLDGVVRDLLMTRVPRPGMASTGHARGYAGSVGHARAAALSVVPPRHGSSRHLHRAAVRAARDVGLDRYLVVRSLWEPALTDVVDGAPPSIGSLPPPVTAAWRGADGHEEPVRGLSFEGVHRLLLRDIVAAGLQNTGSFLAPFAPGASDLGPTEGLATLLSAPDVLVREMELVPLASDPGDPPVLALPSP